MFPNRIASRLRAREIAGIIDKFVARAEQEMQRIDGILAHGEISPGIVGQIRSQMRSKAIAWRDRLTDSNAPKTLEKDLVQEIASIVSKPGPHPADAILSDALGAIGQAAIDAARALGELKLESVLKPEGVRSKLLLFLGLMAMTLLCYAALYGIDILSSKGQEQEKEIAACQVAAKVIKVEQARDKAQLSEAARLTCEQGGKAKSVCDKAERKNDLCEDRQREAEEMKWAVEDKKLDDEVTRSAAEMFGLAAEEKNAVSEEKSAISEAKNTVSEENKRIAEERKRAAEKRKLAAEERKRAAEDKKRAAEDKKSAAQEELRIAKKKEQAACDLAKEAERSCKATTNSKIQCERAQIGQAVNEKIALANADEAAIKSAYNTCRKDGQEFLLGLSSGKSAQSVAFKSFTLGMNILIVVGLAGMFLILLGWFKVETADKILDKLLDGITKAGKGDNPSAGSAAPSMLSSMFSSQALVGTAVAATLGTAVVNSYQQTTYVNKEIESRQQSTYVSKETETKDQRSERERYVEKLVEKTLQAPNDELVLAMKTMDRSIGAITEAIRKIGDAKTGSGGTVHVTVDTKGDKISLLDADAATALGKGFADAIDRANIGLKSRVTSLEGKNNALLNQIGSMKDNLVQFCIELARVEYQAKEDLQTLWESKVASSFPSPTIYYFKWKNVDCKAILANHYSGTGKPAPATYGQGAQSGNSTEPASADIKAAPIR